MTVDEKVDELLSVSGGPFDSRREIYDRIFTYLERRLPNYLSHDSSQDINEVTREDKGHGTYLYGWSGDTPRLIFGYMAEPPSRITNVAIVATTGDTRADEILEYGVRGPGIGNRILVARLLHVGAYAMRSVGIQTMDVVPANGYLAEHFGAMGLEYGKVLRLNSRAGLTGLMTHVETTYREHGLSLTLSPLP